MMHDSQPLAQYGLDVVDCPICGNTGTVVREDENGIRWARACDCVAIRKSIKRLQRSGLSNLVSRYTLASYETPDEKRSGIKAKAQRYIEDTSGTWFFIAGISGSGKTHLCTAICGELLKREEVRYMLWRDEAPKIKGAVTDRENYEALVHPLKAVPILYIDDFLKGSVSDADKNLAFEIINARYNDSSKRTIISSERKITEIVELDEALGSRIYERSRGYMVEPPNENWRLRP